MKVCVQIDGKRRKASVPYEGAEFVCVEGACPACGVCVDAVFKCIGKSDEQSVGHDTITAPALALCCEKHIGTMVVTFSTIFGIEEDRAVLNGRPRVY